MTMSNVILKSGDCSVMFLPVISVAYFTRKKGNYSCYMILSYVLSQDNCSSLDQGEIRISFCFFLALASQCALYLHIYCYVVNMKSGRVGRKLR